jgi:hypothetical protein
MKMSNVRFGEAYKVSLPVLKPYLRGHDGVDFEAVNKAPLEPNGTHWTMLEQLLKKPAALVNAYDPTKKEKATYIITNGPQHDTFDRMQMLKAKAEAVTSSKNEKDVQTTLGFLLPLYKLISGNEPVIALSENVTQQAETLIQHGLAEPDVLETLKR